MSTTLAREFIVVLAPHATYEDHAPVAQEIRRRGIDIFAPELIGRTSADIQRLQEVSDGMRSPTGGLTSHSLTVNQAKAHNGPLFADIEALAGTHTPIEMIDYPYGDPQIDAIRMSLQQPRLNYQVSFDKMCGRTEVWARNIAVLQSKREQYIADRAIHVADTFTPAVRTVLISLGLAHRGVAEELTRRGEKVTVVSTVTQLSPEDQLIRDLMDNKQVDRLLCGKALVQQAMWDAYESLDPTNAFRLSNYSDKLIRYISYVTEQCSLRDLNDWWRTFQSSGGDMIYAIDQLLLSKSISIPFTEQELDSFLAQNNI